MAAALGALFLGHWVDHSGKRAVMLWADGGRALLLALLALLALAAWQGWLGTALGLRPVLWLAVACAGAAACVAATRLAGHDAVLAEAAKPERPGLS